MSTPLRPTVLELKNLHFAHPGEAPLISDASLSIGAGVTQLYGDTGSGKSTLLRVMAGELAARGRLTLAGMSLDEDAEAYRRRVFFRDPTTEAFDQVIARDCGTAPEAGFDRETWRDLVEGFSLAPHLDKPMYMLSTGSKRKVWLAAALACGRPLILLDEPTSGLDAPSIRCLWKALNGLAPSDRRAVVIASAERIDQVDLAKSIRLPVPPR